MKIGALVLGIIGGLIALLYGLLGFGIGSLNDAATAGSGTGIKAISMGLPVAGLLGAGMVIAQPMIGAALMAVCAAGLVYILGFNFFSLIPVVLLGIGAALGFLGGQGEEAKAKPE